MNPGEWIFAVIITVLLTAGYIGAKHFFGHPGRPRRRSSRPRHLPGGAK